ncbi:MAG: dihydropteroate synthase [Bacteroidales bacterium]|nr:dihydropteroate synthase [Bacteroidales bacterium]
MALNSSVFTFNRKGKLSELQLPAVMGILNITPDSFYTESRFYDENEILNYCGQMLSEGASIIDIGAVSTRPGAEYPGEGEELRRLMRAFPALRKAFPDTLFSIDTWNSKIAEAMLNIGADMINDISAGLMDQDMPEVILRHKCPYIIMHMKGDPKTMQSMTDYENLIREVNRFFIERLNYLRSIGIADIIIDPGFGFSKNIEQNYELLDKMQMLTYHGAPVLAGLSRKSMIYKALGITPEESLNGTTALNTIALMKGAGILRVHDVKEAVEVVGVLGKMAQS